MIQPISTDGLRRMLVAGAGTLLDVRGHAEAESGRIPGGIVLPRRDVDLRARRLVPDLGHPVVCYDDAREVIDGNTRASLAAEGFERQGFERAYFLRGGLPAWSRQGHPVERGVNTMSKRFGEQVSHEDAVPMVSADQFSQWQQNRQDVVLVDVRPAAEHARGCIPGAVNIPGVDLARYAGALADSSSTVVTHCAGRTRGIIAAQSLRLLGVSSVYTLKNGIQGWILSGRSLENPPAPHALPAVVPVGRDSPSTLPAVRTLSPRAVATAELDYVFDVRAGAEYLRRHAAGSVHAPGTQLIQTTDEYVGLSAARIGVMDDGDNDLRGGLTAYWLHRMGYEVWLLEGGLDGWVDAGLPTADGREPLPGQLRRSICDTRPASLEAATLVLDVDGSEHYRTGHVPGSTWVSRDWLEADVATFTGPDQPATLVCRHPDAVHARLAAVALRARGYQLLSVLPLEDGAVLTAADPVWARSADDVRLAPHEQGRQAMLDYLAWETSLHNGQGLQPC